MKLSTQRMWLKVPIVLEAAKKGKDTSMYSDESVKNKESDIVTLQVIQGCLLLQNKFKMIENIDKPALSALWPNKKGMSVVLDLRLTLNVVQNLVDFSIMVLLYISLYTIRNSKCSIIEYWFRRIKRK